MALFRNNSLRLMPVMALRTFSVNCLWKRYASFRPILPKFPFPTADIITNKRQLVKPFATPIPKLDSKIVQVKEHIQPPIKKHIEFLRFADEEPDNDDTAVAVVQKEREPDKYQYPMKNAKSLVRLVSNMASDCVTSSDRRRPREPSCSAVVQAKHEQEATAPKLRIDDIFLGKLMKFQQTNMQKLQEQDKRVQIHMNDVKKQERMEKLMQLQKQMEQTEAILIEPRRSGTNPWYSHSKRGVRFANETWPMKTNTVAFYKHPLDQRRTEQIDYQSYTPAHKDSDNGDVQFGAKHNTIKPYTRRSNANSLDREYKPKVSDNESAIYKICKGLPFPQDIKRKY